MRSLAALLAVAALPLACASPPPPATPPPGADPAAPAAAPPPPAAPAAPAPPPSARVTAVEPGKDGKASARAKVVFSNPSGRPCRFVGYTLSWGSARKAITLEGFTLPPGETRERWIKVGADDGDLAALTPEGSSVEVKADCEGAKP
jgi:hypothetical protein